MMPLQSLSIFSASYNGQLDLAEFARPGFRRKCTSDFAQAESRCYDDSGSFLHAGTCTHCLCGELWMRAAHFLLLFLCATAAALPAFASTGEELAEQVAEAAEAQEYREEAPEEVVAEIVDEAPPAVLNAGTGDVSTTGACAADIDTFCVDITPGAGRIAECLSGQMREDEGKAEGGELTISEECLQELDEFKIDRSTNINKDLGLVFRTQQEAAQDFRLDAMLHELCEPDAAALCADVEVGEGRIQECLRQKRAQLSWDCQEELFRKEVEDADDLRLSVTLYKKCLGDKKKFCSDIKPGANRAKDCLEENKDAAGFSEDCKAEIEAMMERRMTDFRLDATLREVCYEDIEEICGYEKESLDSIAGYDGRVENCLMDYRDEILRPECAARVHKLIMVASGDIRMNVPLADACFEDRAKFCADVAPGSARVIRCLQDSREDLGYECRATLFDQEVRMSESLDFMYPMKKACTKELEQLCKDVPEGHARQIKCLQENVDSQEMGPMCRQEVRRQEERQAEDYRLNFRLNAACEADVDELCADVCSSFQGQACGGTVYRCLTDNRDNIKDDVCKDEVFYFLKMEVNDFRNDVLLAEACRTDVNTYCADVEAGNGRVHTCLRRNRANLSPACKDEERKLNIIQAENIELRPRLKKLCKEERSVYCKDVAAGKGRVVRCLQENLAKPGFSQGCRVEINRRQSLRNQDYRLDFGVAKECKDDILGVCKEAKDKADGENAAVLLCLIKNHPDLQLGCQGEVARALRMALWSYAPGVKITAACDSAVTNICGVKAPVKPKFGKVGKCLKTNIDKLDGECKSLVDIGAPQDARSDFVSTLTLAGLHSHMRTIEKTFGFSRGTLVERKKGVRMITLTGWTALCGMFSLIVVLIGGLYALYYQQRYGKLPDIDAAERGPMVVKGSKGS
eukprot:scaffold127716_cov50-Prasinocladus_malaysianus.AAC.1